MNIHNPCTYCASEHGGRFQGAAEQKKWLSMMMMFICCFIFVCCIENGFGVCDKNGVRNKRSSGHAEDEKVSEEGPKGGHHEDHSALIDSLFKHYDSSSSPTHGTDEPTIISVNLQLISLDDISDARMEVVIDARITFSWDDARLVSPECRDEGEDCDDHFDLKAREAELWTPDLYVLNSRLARYHDQPTRNGMLYLVASGKVFLSKRLTLTLRCPMNLVRYPLDTQQCPLLICPYSLPEKELLLRWTEGEGVGMLEAEEEGQSKFHLLHPIHTSHVNLKYNGPDVAGSFSCVNATFRLRRQNGYHMGYSYTITSFIVLVSWIGFYIPPTAVPARITLGVTTLLTLLTTANFVRASLPPIAYVTAIDVWVGGCTVFVFAVLLLFPISHHCVTRQSSKVSVVLMKSNIGRPSERSRSRGQGGSMHEVKNATQVDVDSKCRFVFPCFFLVFNVSYWCYYLT